MKKWGNQPIAVQRCGQAIMKANFSGKEVPEIFYQKMAMFSVEEIEAIEAYVAYKTFCGEYAPGADYMTPEQMEEKVSAELKSLE